MEKKPVLLFVVSEQEWDAVEGRYRDRPSAEAESARLNAAQDTRELPAPPDESETDKAP